MKGEKLTQEQLKEALSYNSETGVFYRCVAHKDKKVGSVNGGGYVLIRVMGKLYSAHRLAWMYIHGEFPSGQIDHIDGDKTNNRISNLRDFTATENAINSTTNNNHSTGVKGVIWVKFANSWRTAISVGGKHRHFGYYRDFDEAVCARLALEQCMGWDNINLSSPAYRYVRDKIQTPFKRLKQCYKIKIPPNFSIAC